MNQELGIWVHKLNSTLSTSLKFFISRSEIFFLLLLTAMLVCCKDQMGQDTIILKNSTNRILSSLVVSLLGIDSVNMFAQNTTQLLKRSLKAAEIMEKS